MKKRVFLLIGCLLVLATALTGCLIPPDGSGPNGPGSDPSGDGNGRVMIDSETAVKIILPSNPSSKITAAAEKLEAAIEQGIGATARIWQIGTEGEPAGDTEINLGATGEIASRFAVNAVSGYEGDALYGSFAIYTTGFSVGIASKYNACYEMAVDHFINNYLSGESFTLDGELEVVQGIEEYPFDEDAFAARFDVYNEYFDSGAVKELQALYGIYTPGLIEWAANLYDPDIGGFYYANSAQQYVGFLPDIESTGQLLGFVSGYGAFVGFDGSYAKALPDDIKEAIGSWVYGLQDPDGYFYEPQFGKTVNTSKKGRNFDSAMSMLRNFGITPKYGNPLATSHESELASPLGQSAVVAASKVLATARLDPYLQSEEAFLEWLEALNINGSGKSYSAGHTISSVRTQIEAAGLADFCIDWLNSKQKENGLWEEGEVSYSKLNGLLKISTLYEDFNAPFPRVELGIQACIDTVLSEAEQSAIVDIYNCWVALGILIPNVKEFGSSQSYENAKDILFDNAEELISRTTDKLLVFRKDDGSFSYFPDKSSSTSQGALVSLGVNEGDVNATGLALGTLASLCKAYEVERLAVFTPRDGEAFIDTVKNLGSTVKIEQEIEMVDFNSCETIDDLPPVVSISFNQFDKTSHPTTLGTWSLLPHEEDESDLYLDLVSRPETGDQLHFKFPQVSGSCSVFESDVKFSGGGIQIFFRDTGGRDVLMFTVSNSGENVIFSDHNSTSAVANEGIFKLKKDTWHKLRIEYYDFEDGTARTKIYVGDKIVTITDSFIGNGTAEPKESFCRVEFRATISADTAYSVDNVICYSENIVYNEDGYTPPSNENEVFTFDDQGVGGELPEGLIQTATGTGGGTSEIAERDGDDLYYKIQSLSGVGDTLKVNVKQTGEGAMVFETDIIFESMDVTGLQLFIGDAVMLTFDKSGSDIVIKDYNKRSGGNIINTLATLSVGEWYTLRVEYYVTEDGPYTKLYIDGDCVAITKNYVGNGVTDADGNPANTPATTFSTVQMYATIGGVLTVGLDNIYADYDSELEYDDRDYSGDIIGEWIELE